VTDQTRSTDLTHPACSCFTFYKTMPLQECHIRTPKWG